MWVSGLKCVPKAVLPDTLCLFGSNSWHVRKLSDFLFHKGLNLSEGEGCGMRWYKEKRFSGEGPLMEDLRTL